MKSFHILIQMFFWLPSSVTLRQTCFAEVKTAFASDSRHSERNRTVAPTWIRSVGWIRRCCSSSDEEKKIWRICTLIHLKQTETDLTNYVMLNHDGRFSSSDIIHPQFTSLLCFCRNVEHKLRACITNILFCTDTYCFFSVCVSYWVHCVTVDFPVQTLVSFPLMTIFTSCQKEHQCPQQSTPSDCRPTPDRSLSGGQDTSSLLR